jgi:hypothetical protein
LSGSGLSDEPLLCTGGGATELRLDLLFDTDLDDSTSAIEDVRDLSGPLWRLTETSWRADGGPSLPIVRLLWGKQWNIPGVVSAVAERLDCFTPGGMPHRSWLRMRFLRVDEPGSTAPVADAAADDDPTAPTGDDLPSLDFDDDDGAAMPSHELVGDGNGDGERLDAIAARYYGDPDYWRVIAHCNGIDDPQHLPRGTVLRLPPAPLVARRLIDNDDDSGQEA